MSVKVYVEEDVLHRATGNLVIVLDSTTAARLVAVCNGFAASQRRNTPDVRLANSLCAHIERALTANAES